MSIQSKLLGIGLLCSTAVSCSLVFDSDEYLAKEDNTENDGGGGKGGSSPEQDGGESGSGGLEDADAGDSGTDAGDGTTDAGDSGGEDAGSGGDADSGNPPPPVQCDEETDCNELLGAALAICVDGECVDCNKDGDDFVSPDGRCNSLVEPFELRDCDDDDRDRYPHAPPICGDGKFNSCDVALTSEAAARFQLAEIGFIGLTLISSVPDVLADTQPADFTLASQISITGRQVGEVGVNSHLLTAVAFMDSEDSADQPVAANIARLMTIETWGDGWPNARDLDQYNLNELTRADDIRSVSIRRLSNRNTIITAMIGNDPSSDSGSSTLWYSRVASAGGDSYEPLDIESVPIPQNALCGENRIESADTLFPRLAIAGQATDGLAKAVWTQSASSSQSPIIVSHVYSAESSSFSESAFNCTTLDILPADTSSVELVGSSGPFVIGGSAERAFSWEGTGSSPITTLDVADGSRPALAFFDDADYLVAVGGEGGYWASNLVCQPGGTEPCAFDTMSHVALDMDTRFAAMDNLGTDAAVLGLVETTRTSGSSWAKEEVVVRILGRNGDILPIGGVRYQIEPGSSDAEPQQPQTSSLFPVFELEPSDDSSSTIRVVDLAVSSWFEESSTASEYPLTILVAAIVTTDGRDPVSDGEPVPGNLIVITGIRGCREL